MNSSGWKLRYNLGKSKDSKGHFAKAGSKTGNENQNIF